jgi:hypothetical protein
MRSVYIWCLLWDGRHKRAVSLEQGRLRNEIKTRTSPNLIDKLVIRTNPLPALFTNSE